MSAGVRKPLAIVAAVAVAAVLPLYLTVQWEQILLLAGVYALLALGLNVVVGFAGLLDLGYAAFWAIGAYTTAILLGAAPIQPLPWVLPVWVVIPIAMAVCMLAGVILGAPVLRLRGDYLAIVTLGFGEIVRLAAENLEGVTNGARGIGGIPEPSVPAWAWTGIPNFFISIANGLIRALNWIWWGEDVRALGKVQPVGTVEFGVDPKPFYYLVLVVILLAIFALGRLNDTRVGRAWVAIREDEGAAEAMGVDTLKMKLLAFAIGAGTASFAGVIAATNLGYISPADFVVFVSIQILAMVVLGGLGSILGAIVGGVVIIVIPELMRDPAIVRSAEFGQTVDEYRFLVFGAILVVMMILRPQGIVPSRRRAAEMLHASSEEAAPAIPTELETTEATE